MLLVPAMIAHFLKLTMVGGFKPIIINPACIATVWTLDSNGKVCTRIAFAGEGDHNYVDVRESFATVEKLLRSAVGVDTPS